MLLKLQSGPFRCSSWAASQRGVILQTRGQTSTQPAEPAGKAVC